MTPWLILFKNSFLANFLLSLKGEYVYEIMLRLNYNPKMILIISVSAAFLAQTVNFLIGLGIWKLYEKKVISIKYGKFITYKEPFYKYLWWSPFVVFIPLWGNIIAFSSGLLDHGIKKFLFKIFMGLTLYYSIMIMV